MREELGCKALACHSFPGSNAPYPYKVIVEVFTAYDGID